MMASIFQGAHAKEIGYADKRTGFALGKFNVDEAYLYWWPNCQAKLRQIPTISQLITAPLGGFSERLQLLLWYETRIT